MSALYTVSVIAAEIEALTRAARLDAASNLIGALRRDRSRYRMDRRGHRVSGNVVQAKGCLMHRSFS